MSRPTIKSLAQELGLSVGTVSKALHGKPPISEATRKRVLRAARKAGYTPNRLAQKLVRPVLNISVVYPSAWPSHFELLMQGVREKVNELSDHRIAVTLTRVPGFSDGDAFLATLRRLRKNSFDGMVVTIGDYNADVRSRAWKRLTDLDIPFVLLGTNVEEKTPALSSVWHDCRRCGSMAADLLHLMTGPRPTAVFIGFRRHPDHRQKIEGFEQATADTGIGPVHVAEALDDPEQAYPAAEKCFAQHPDTAGIYIGTENAAGICRYLQESGLAGKVKVVATGDSEDVRDMMRAGVVHASVNQNQVLQGRRAVGILVRFLEDGDKPSREVLIPPDVILRSNLDLLPRSTCGAEQDM